MNKFASVFNKIKSWNLRKILIRSGFVVLGTSFIGAGVFYKLFQEINKFSTHIQKFETHMTEPINNEEDTPNLIEYSYNALTIFFKNLEDKEDLNEKLISAIGNFHKGELKLLNPNFVTIVSNELFLLPKIT
jgi:hypothetical protein